MSRKVAIYARVSTEHEAQLSALDNQIQYYDDILTKHPDWVLHDRYIDEGITGTSIHKRPNFLRMMKDAENGCFDLIITREVSRFARNTVDTLQETRKLKKIGVEVYFTEDNIWTFNDEDGELKLTIMATLAQNESKKTSIRVKAGQKISFQNGVFYGNGNILGYDKVGKEMIINEEQAKTVRLIFDLYLQGKGTRKIQFELEKLGYLTATGLKRWSCSAIVRILRNPFYSGTIVYRKSYVPDFLEQKHKLNHGEVEQIIVEGKHQPIVSKEEFQKVQQMLSENSIMPKKCDGSQPEKGRGKKASYSIWGKKLVCKCGSSFNKKIYHKYKDGRKTYCYQCYKQIKTGTIQTRLNKGLSIEGICDSMLIPEWKLQLVANKVFEVIWGDKDKILEITNNLLNSVVKECDKDEVEIDIENINNQKEKIKEKIDKLFDSYLNNIIEKDFFIKKKLQLDEETKKLDNELIELKKSKPLKNNNLQNKMLLLKNTIEESLNYKNAKTMEELIDKLIEKIIIHNNTISWKLNLYDILESEDDSEERFVLLTKLVITSDDIRRFAKEINTKLTCKNPIYVNIYM